MDCTCIASLWCPKALYNSLQFTRTPLGAIQASFSCPFKHTTTAGGSNPNWEVGVWTINLSLIGQAALRPEPQPQSSSTRIANLVKHGREVTALTTKWCESLPDFTGSAAQMNECDDDAPEIALRKSKVTVVTSYGTHFSSRLACVIHLSLFPRCRSPIRQAQEMTNSHLSPLPQRDLK